MPEIRRFWDVDYQGHPSRPHYRKQMSDGSWVEILDKEVDAETKRCLAKTKDTTTLCGIDGKPI